MGLGESRFFIFYTKVLHLPGPKQLQEKLGRTYYSALEVLVCAPVAVSIDPKGIQGTVFQLCKTGGVTWKVPEDAILTPLFKCDTYEVVSKMPYMSNFILRFGTYKGHVIDCSVKICEPYNGVISINDGWCLLVCKKFKDIVEEDPFGLPFSFLPALQDSYFSDLKLKASNNKEFNVHSCILKLCAPEVDWSNKLLFSNLPEDVLFTILYFLYAQCLPAGLKENTIKSIISVASEIPGLENLVSLCHTYIKNKALKNQIFSLVSDIHACASQIIEYFTDKHSNSSFNTLTSDPARLCFAVKNSIREAAVATAKLLMICDLFTKQKNELSKEEGQEIILHAKSRIPFFMNQLESFLQAIKTTFCNLLPSQRQELACYLVPEVEIILDTISSLLIKIKAVLESMLNESEVEEQKNSHKVLENLEQYTDSVLLQKELNRRQSVIQRISNILLHLNQKKEIFNLMTSRNKIRSVAKKLEELMEELPIIVLRVEEFTNAIEEKLHWNESQFCFKVGASKVSEVIKKLVTHKESLQDVLIELCDLVQRDSFSQTFVALGLLESSLGTASNCSEAIQSDECERLPSKEDPHKFDMKSSICVPPPAHQNHLSEAAYELLKSGVDSDMTFEIITSNESSSVADQSEGISAELPTDAHSQVEICEMAAHRVIVASRCDWFRRALLSGMQEDINRKIQVHDTNSHVFSLFLKYLYSGQLDCLALSVDHISELLLLSDRYELDSLKQICEYGLKAHVDGDSVLYFYSLADRFNAKILKNACEQFITQHPEVIDSELFEELSDNLQSEVYGVVICGKPQTIDLPLEKVFSDISYNVTDIEEMIASVHINSNLPSPEGDDTPLSQDFLRLEEALVHLREIVGERVSRSQLVQLILAADYDVNRALNFYYSSS